MPEPSYRIDHQPCIPVLMRDGTHAQLGLRDVLLQAHDITVLALPLAPALSVLLRVLIVIAARITGLDNAASTAPQWTAGRTHHLNQPGFNPEAVHTYLDRYSWDLYGTRPFWQDPALAAQCAEAAGVNKLAFGRPAGRNLAWQSPHTDTDPAPLASDCAFWHLLIWHGYGDGGRCSARAHGPAGSHRGQGSAGPLRSLQVYHPLAATLYETLLAGIPKPTGHQELPDLAPWEQDTPPDPGEPLPPLTWPARLLLRSRHALLLLPDPTGAHTVDAHITWATHQPRLPVVDPFAIYDVDPRKNLPDRLLPRKADRNRALFRDIDALLLAGHEGPTRRPLVLSTLNDLPARVRRALRVHTMGFDQDGRTMNYAWSQALTPPIWRFCEENDPARARLIADSRISAETTATQLSSAAARAWAQATDPAPDGPAIKNRQLRTKGPWTHAALGLYWPRAEATFWRLATEPDQPQDPTADQPAEADGEAMSTPDPRTRIRRAFAADAIAALREAVAPSLLQHRRAGQALAEAEKALRASTRPPARPTRRSTWTP